MQEQRKEVCQDRDVSHQREPAAMVGKDPEGHPECREQVPEHIHHVHDLGGGQPGECPGEDVVTLKITESDVQWVTFSM